MSVTRRLLLKTKRFHMKSVCGLQCFSSDSAKNNILTSDVSDVDIPSVTIPEFFYSKIVDYHHLTATVCGETGRSYTFEQLRVNSRNLSKALRKILKLNKKDTIAILLPNLPEYPICVLGALEAGLTITTMNPLYTSEEICRQLLDSSAKAIITLPDLYSTAKSAVLATKKLIPIISIKTKNNETVPEGAINFNELVTAQIDIPDFEPENSEDIAVLPYSSGTTGLPKGVELTHHNIISNICQILHKDVSYVSPASDFLMSLLLNYWVFQRELPRSSSSNFAYVPHIRIHSYFTSFLSLGSKLITLKKFAPDLFINILKNYSTTIMFVAPPMVLFLAAHPDVKVEYLKSLKTVMSGAAPLGSLDEERFLNKAGNHVKMFQGTPLGPNQPGELLIKGPQVMKSYHNRPEETKKAFLDGWLRTGDLMHYNENGLLYVTDRLKELIKVKGFQVAPAELEEVIRDFPSVEDAAVIGVPIPLTVKCQELTLYPQRIKRSRPKS
ncbi:hypothetical protein NQ317_015227 [Molorchus minor]|uniref:AMP-dependent synthetase/ligase domain-containing protein n=1 Tax=Molorchus minor TaxID=1323400 RepID=A0ABQ9J9Q0_9CUCU|nr:hypothetical protein NQ317_015227 [Molorchus minor]